MHGNKLVVHFCIALSQCSAATDSSRWFSDINISQGSVATRLRRGGIFNECFIANFLEIVTVKELTQVVTAMKTRSHSQNEAIYIQNDADW